MKTTVLPQEWSLFGYGVTRRWFLSSEQTQVVQQEIHRFRESRRSISLGFYQLALTLLPRSRHFQMQGSPQEVSSREISPLPRESSGSGQPHTFHMKAELSAYTPAGIESLFTITLQLQRNTKWLLACTKNRVSWEDRFNILPLAALPWPFGTRLLKNTQQLVSTDFIPCPKVTPQSLLVPACPHATGKSIQVH